MPPNEKHVATLKAAAQAATPPPPHNNSPILSSTASIIPARTNTTQLIRLQEVPRDYGLLQLSYNAPSYERNDLEEPWERYEPDSIPGISGNCTPSSRGIWTGTDGADQRIDGKLSYGRQQTVMLYFDPPQASTGSTLHRIKLEWDTKKQLPFIRKGTEIQHLLVNVKASDDYLGSLWIGLPELALSKILPADVARDGTPFANHQSWGMAFYPRMDKIDYPSSMGMSADMWVGYIQCADSNVVFLTGDTPKFNNSHFNDLHYYAIDIISRDWDKLYAVLDEPEELRRQRLH
jgi:hypothetical protein